MSEPVIAFGDADDPRVLAAVERLAAEGGLEPVLVGGDGTGSSPVARIAVPTGADPITLLAEVVATGRADAGVAGSLSSSAIVIRAGIRALRADRLVTGCFTLLQSDRWMTFADCSVVPSPAAAEMADIAEAAASHHSASFGVESRIAMLSFSSGGSAEHADVHKVREATAILRKRRPDLAVEGEIQFDAAIDLAVGARKLPGSEVAGRANVFVFPDLDAGNIAYKVAERLGGAQALGSFVLNLRRPWVDLSRGCTVDDIVGTALLLAAAPRTTLDRTPA